MTKERTPYDYMAKDRFVVGADDANLSEGAVYSDKPLPGEGSVYMAGSGSKAGAGRGKQGGPTADELETDRLRKYREAMNAEYASRAKMLGKTKDQYVKDQAAKEKAALKKAPIEDFMTDSGMKKGGSVKGWGKARGARKAKIY